MIHSTSFRDTADIPLSGLGISTGRCSLDGTELVVAMKIYFDGSGGEDDAGSKWITLAGFATSDILWKKFCLDWETMLKERYPIAPYIHMNEMYSGTDPFERGVAGWTEEKVGRLVLDAMDILQKMEKEVFRSFVCSVDVTGRERLVGEGYVVDDPITLCTEMCLGRFNNWKWGFEDDRRLGLSYLFFDRGEHFVTDLKRRWLENRTPPGKVVVDRSKLFWDFIGDIQEVDMERNPPIQAADMVAWARTRSLSEKERPGRHVAHIMRQIIPHDTAIITEEKMRSKSVKIGINETRSN